jgi:myosin heavy subunit
VEVDKAGLEQAIWLRKIKAEEDKHSTSLPRAGRRRAENTRDALARFLYGERFDWLVPSASTT